MASAAQSRRELIRRRRRNSFVGRAGELDAFRANLGRRPDDPSYQFLFHVHGNAGVGKSTLVRQWETVAAEAGAVTAYLDDRAHGPLEAMEAISGRLAAQGCALDRFTKQLDRLRRRAHGTQAEQGASPGATLAAQAALGGAGLIPFAGPVAGALSPEQVAHGADRVRAAVAGRARAARVSASPPTRRKHGPPARW